MGCHYEGQLGASTGQTARYRLDVRPAVFARPNTPHVHLRMCCLTAIRRAVPQAPYGISGGKAVFAGPTAVMPRYESLSHLLTPGKSRANHIEVVCLALNNNYG